MPEPPWRSFPKVTTPDDTAFDRVTKWFQLAREYSDGTHDTPLLPLMTLESAESSPTPSNPHHGTTVFSLTVPRSLCNMSGNLHGGAVALIFDICTSMSIAAYSKDGHWDSGHVSRNLNCTYLRPVAEGEKIYVESDVVHLGKSMGLTNGVIRNEQGKVCYTCEHGKANVGSRL